MYKTIGTCGNCGGQVTVPNIWHSVIPPVPTCQSCGATARQHGPVIDMNPPVKTWTSAGTGSYKLLGRRVQLTGADTADLNQLSEDRQELQKSWILGEWVLQDE